MRFLVIGMVDGINLRIYHENGHAQNTINSGFGGTKINDVERIMKCCDEALDRVEDWQKRMEKLNIKITDDPISGM